MKTTIHAEPNVYDFHCQVLFIQTIYKLDEGLFMHNCICVFTMMVLCRHKLRFPKHGRSQVKKILCFYIWYDHHMGSIEAWRMLWHLSSNGSRVWLCNWGKGYMSAERSVQLVSQVGEIKYGNSNSGTFWAATISLGELPHGECIIFARIPVQIVLLNEGYHYQTRSLFEVKTDLSTLMYNDHGIFPVPSVLLHRGLVILSQFVTDYLCWY